MDPYTPSPLPLELPLESLIQLIGQAHQELGGYRSLLRAVPNPDILLAPMTTQEAVLSSKIEGTQATLEEVLEYEAGHHAETERKESDIREIINYRSALTLAMEGLASSPISLQLIRSMHSILMEGVRGHNSHRGQFRDRQNWIGRPGCRLEEATFVPPSPLHLQEHLNKLEQYLRSDDRDLLIQTAVIHAQFELIHPFLDGNGRIGRALIPLFLYSKGAIASPTFYISAHLEANRGEYYARLRAISQERDWLGWIRFFLIAIKETARNLQHTVQTVLDLYTDTKALMPVLARTQHAVAAIDQLFQRPIFTAAQFSQHSGIPSATARRLLTALEKEEMIAVLQAGGGRTPRIYAFQRLLDLVR